VAINEPLEPGAYDLAGSPATMRVGAAAWSIEAPTDPDCAPAWALALAKFTARVGRAPETKDEWRAMIEDYHVILTKPRGSLGTVLSEVICRDRIDND
jgi:hypothetical protein